MVAAAVGIGSAVAGLGSAALNSRKGSGGSQTTDASPWAPQAQAVQNLYGQAQSVYDQRKNEGSYQGNLYSPINGIQSGVANQGANWAAAQGNDLANGTAYTSGALQGAAQPYLLNADRIAQNGTGGPNAGLMGTLSGYAQGTQQLGQGINPALSSALNSSALQGAGQIGQFAQGLSNVSNAGMSDPTSQLASQAGVYMNAAPIQQQMNAANADIRNTLGETTSGLNFQASQGGALNSSRAGMAEGMANRDAARQIASSDASIMGNAYNQGLQTAAQQRTSGQQAALGANSAGLNASSALAQGVGGMQQQQGQFDTTSRLGAANSGLAQGLGYNSLNAQTQLAGNQQLGQGTQMGLQGAGMAQGLAGQNFNLGQQAGGIYQGDQNAQLADQYQQWQQKNSYGQNILSPYAQIVQQGFQGVPSSTTSNQVAPNYLGNIAGSAAAGYGLYDKFANGSQPSPTNNWGSDPYAGGSNGWGPDVSSGWN